MRKRNARFMLAFLLLFIVLQMIDVPFSGFGVRNGDSVSQQNLGVRNVNTGKSYSTIQEAIDASETLDGHEIQVAPGIYREHITVTKSLTFVGEDKDTTIIEGKGFDKVVYITANNVELRSFTIQNGTFGVWLYYSNNSRIIGNTLQDGSYGIRVYHSRNSRIIENTVRRFTFFGVEIDSSGNSTLRNNNIRDNRYNFGVDGKTLFDFTNDIDTSNTVNGKPIRYLANQHDAQIDSGSFQDIGYLGLVNASNFVVKDLNFQDNIQGVMLAFAANSTIKNVNARSNWNGIYVAHSSNIIAEESKANYNFDYGIKFFNSSQSIARNNNVTNNGWAGIGFFGSSNSIIDGNDASFCTYNIHIVFTNNTVITKNNSLKKAGGYSIALYYSHHNYIYHNTLENALLFVETRNGTRFTPSNNWDNGLEGNYWTTYGGKDADYDGLGDIPRVVGENNTDNHPLIGKFSEFTIDLEGKAYQISVISNSTISELQYAASDNSITMAALGRNGTQGFLRVAIPNTLLQDLQEENVGFLVNGELPHVKKYWTDETYAYAYLIYANTTAEPEVNPWLLPALFVIVLLLVLALVFLILRKKTLK